MHARQIVLRKQSHCKASSQPVVNELNPTRTDRLSFLASIASDPSGNRFLSTQQRKKALTPFAIARRFLSHSGSDLLLHHCDSVFGHF